MIWLIRVQKNSMIIKRVLKAKYLLPVLFNFRAGSNSEFKENYLFRNIGPNKSNKMELTRLQVNPNLYINLQNSHRRQYN